MSGLRADKMPAGTVCGPCSRDRHRFLHPHALPIGHLWREEDGCPCCYSHVDLDGDSTMFAMIPPMGYGDDASGVQQ